LPKSIGSFTRCLSKAFVSFVPHMPRIETYLIFISCTSNMVWATFERIS
jgi:hypothetical protein